MTLFLKGLPMTKFGPWELERNISYESYWFASFSVISCYGNHTAQPKGSEFLQLASKLPIVYTANKFAYFVNPYLLPALFKLEAEENIAYSPRCSFHANQNNRHALVFCPEDNIDIEKNFKLHPGLSDRQIKDVPLLTKKLYTCEKNLRIFYTVFFGYVPISWQNLQSNLNSPQVYFRKYAL